MANTFSIQVDPKIKAKIERLYKKYKEAELEEINYGNLDHPSSDILHAKWRARKEAREAYKDALDVETKKMSLAFKKFLTEQN